MNVTIFSITKSGKIVTNRIDNSIDILARLDWDGLVIRNIIEDLTSEAMDLGGNNKKVASLDRMGFMHTKETTIYEDTGGDTGGDTTFKAYKFGMLADTHIDGDSDDEANSISDVKKAINFFNANANMICIAGDVGRDGREPDYKTCKNLFAKSKIPVYAARGNHDNYQSNSGKWFKQYLGLEDDYVIEKEGDIFIFLSMANKDYSSGGFTTEKLDWLETQLNTYKDKRKFLIYHVFVPGKSGNAGGVYKSLMKLSNSKCARFAEMIDGESNLIFCNGHSHLYFKCADKYSDANYYHKSGKCHYVHTPSATRPRDSKGANSLSLGQGYLVEVSKDKVKFRAYDIVNAKFLPDYDFTINVANVQ